MAPGLNRKALKRTKNERVTRVLEDARRARTTKSPQLPEGFIVRNVISDIRCQHLFRSFGYLLPIIHGCALPHSQVIIPSPLRSKPLAVRSQHSRRRHRLLRSGWD